jgi:hypothetical protein
VNLFFFHLCYFTPTHSVIMDTSIRQWYSSIPPITRGLFTASIVTPLLGRFGIIHPYTLLLHWPSIMSKFQLWRLFTCFFYAQPGFGLMMNLYMLYRYSGDLETITFFGRPADYAFFICFSMLSALAGSVITQSFVLSDALVMSIIHYWSHRHGEQIVQFMFGMRFKARYMTMVLLGFDLLMSGTLPMTGLLGVASAYTYIQLVESLPAQGRPRRLQTPGVFYRLFPSRRPPTTGTRPTTNTTTTAAARTTGHAWGPGRRLGDA